MTDLQSRIARALDRVRPYLKADGGDVRVVRMTDEGILEVAWEGTCTICPLSVMTLRAGVERVVMKECPEVHRVEAVTP
jgi:Fe-S cluster biogenesis protein NfuA